MSNYKVLDQQIYSSGEYAIVPIRSEDQLLIMNWRNQQIHHLRQSQPLAEAGQAKYFKEVIAALFSQDNPSQILFSFLKNNECIGYGGLVHINWIDRNAEISFIMNTALEQSDFASNWSMFLKLIEEVAFKGLKFHKIYTYAFDIRPHLYPVLKNAKFFEDARLKDHCFFEGEYVDVLIHFKLNNVDQVSLRMADENDLNLVFNWSNDDEVRSQSFSSDKIDINEHTKWFRANLMSTDEMMFIVEFDSSPAGLIRFSKKSDHALAGILVAPQFRGKGLSSKLLVQGSKKCLRIWGLPIHAHIKEENLASKKAFEKAGYSIHSTEIIQEANSYIYIFEK